MASSVDRVSPVLELIHNGETFGLADWSGLESLELQVNLGAGDELRINIAVRQEDGTWRSAMPVWGIGSKIEVWLGWDNDLMYLQTFEIVSTSVDYAEEGDDMFTLRGVSELARAARNKTPRAYEVDDVTILRALCSEYGWTMSLTADEQSKLASPGKRSKETGTSDLTLLNLIAQEASLGKPRVDGQRNLLMPYPDASRAGELVFTRGSSIDLSSWRRLHSLNMNQDGGGTNFSVAVLAWDPIKKAFVQIVYEADIDSGDPIIVRTGVASREEIPDSMSTQGYVISVLRDGGDISERADVLATGKFMDEQSADSLAKRWFRLRELLSRWGTAVVDGDRDLVPYRAVTFTGDLAPTDRGVWLPNEVTHIIDASGYRCEMKVIRVVEEARVKRAL